MPVSLGDHEIVKWTHENVDIKLSTSDGTTIVASGCQITLTNQNIHIVASAPSTYRVANKGDRTFTRTRVPLRLAKPHRFIQPWFGPYKWETIVSGQLPDGDIEPQKAIWKLVLTFTSGGAFEYRSNFLKAFADISQAAQDGMEEPLPAYSEF